MRWGRGFFRVWVVASALWISGFALMAYSHHQTGRLVFQHYQHATQLRSVPHATDWTRPLPEVAHRPMHGPRPEHFSIIEPQHLGGFTEKGTRGEMRISQLADGSRLYLSSDWTEADHDALTGEFWRQRRGRYAEEMAPYAAWGFGAPLAVLSLGLLFRWALLGFRSHG